MRRLLVLLCAAVFAQGVAAVSAVNPFGVNVRSNGPTTVFLTFQNLDPGEVAAEAFWCGELQPALMAADPQLQAPIPVQLSNPCVPGTLYGRLPLSLDRSRTSTSGAFANLTDIMTIPASVARRALQEAQSGLNSSFFYVRRFSGPGGDRFVVVTCRLAGGGARVPLALTDVRIAFETPGGAPVVAAVARGTSPPRFLARILYNGSGTLRGRWEVVQPGDPEPSEEDLLTAATLPVERRAQQRRWTQLERFEVFLPPTGDFTLPGPDPSRLPHDADGPYKVLLRVEATDDREATSNTGGGRLAIAGGVAGFPLPVLRYYVGSGSTIEALAAAPATLTLIAPQEAATVREAPPLFSWIDTSNATLARLEVQGVDGREVLSALLRPGTGQYASPPWFADQQRGQPLRWRVLALDADGRVRAASPWRTLEIR